MHQDAGAPSRPLAVDAPCSGSNSRHAGAQQCMYVCGRQTNKRTCSQDRQEQQAAQHAAAAQRHWRCRHDVQRLPRRSWRMQPCQSSSSDNSAGSPAVPRSIITLKLEIIKARSFGGRSTDRRGVPACPRLPVALSLAPDARCAQINDHLLQLHTASACGARCSLHFRRPPCILQVLMHGAPTNTAQDCRHAPQHPTTKQQNNKTSNTVAQAVLSPMAPGEASA